MTLIRIERAVLGSYQQPLGEPVGNARWTWSAREGLLLELADDQGSVGQGEASPLPGYSSDTLSDNRAALETLDLRGLTLDLDSPVFELLERVTACLPTEARAARFALEAALLDLIGHRLDVPAWALLSGRSRADPPAPLPLARLLETPDLRDWNSQAREALAQGYTTLKLKLGREGDEVSALGELRSLVGPDVKLRLDANQAWDCTRAARILRDLVAIDPEFVEEPVAGYRPGTISAASRVLDTSPVPIALDESLQSPSIEAALSAGAFPRATRALVLKPTALGGILRCSRLGRWAERLGLQVVVSHTLEGPIAWAACAQLALSLSSPQSAAGLAPHAGLAAWSREPMEALSSSRLVPTFGPGLGLQRVALSGSSA